MQLREPEDGAYRTNKVSAIYPPTTGRCSTAKKIFGMATGQPQMPRPTEDNITEHLCLHLASVRSMLVTLWVRCNMLRQQTLDHD